MNDPKFKQGFTKEFLVNFKWIQIPLCLKSQKEKQ